MHNTRRIHKKLDSRTQRVVPLSITAPILRRKFGLAHAHPQTPIEKPKIRCSSRLQIYTSGGRDPNTGSLSLAVLWPSFRDFVSICVVLNAISRTQLFTEVRLQHPQHQQQRQRRRRGSCSCWHCCIWRCIRAVHGCEPKKHQRCDRPSWVSGDGGGRGMLGWRREGRKDGVDERVAVDVFFVVHTVTRDRPSLCGPI